MPIAKLYIEGNIESEILNPILQGSPVLQQGGSKNTLRPRARTDRQENRIAAGYLRDRDFDFDPPVDLLTPTEDAKEGDIPFGWRWCRHEIENYLLEPALVSEAMGWPDNEIETAIHQAATNIRSYEAARWTVGVVRRALPPQYELATRPDGLNEIALPAGLDRITVENWAVDNIRTHRERIVSATDPHQVKEIFDDFLVRFDEEFLSDAAKILLWFSGKDILAGMADWFEAKAIGNVGLFRANIRDWIITNPERTLELLPEWANLRKTLRSGN